LPEGVRCYAIGVALSPDAPGSALLGDGLVPLNSALGRHADPAHCLDFPESNCWVDYGLNHMDLLDDAGVYAQLKRWLC